MKILEGIQKFNSGTGALLCPQCRVIVAYGFDHQKAYQCHFCSEKNDDTTMVKGQKK